MRTSQLSAAGHVPSSLKASTCMLILSQQVTPLQTTNRKAVLSWVSLLRAIKTITNLWPSAITRSLMYIYRSQKRKRVVIVRMRSARSIVKAARNARHLVCLFLLREGEKLVASRMQLIAIPRRKPRAQNPPRTSFLNVDMLCFLALHCVLAFWSASVAEYFPESLLTEQAHRPLTCREPFNRPRMTGQQMVSQFLRRISLLLVCKLPLIYSREHSTRLQFDIKFWRTLDWVPCFSKCYTETQIKYPKSFSGNRYH